MRSSWLLWCGLWLASCGGKQDSLPDYQARVQAARERVMDATCACAWSEHLRQQCLLYAEAATKACTPELAQQFADQQAGYARCIVDATERHARCLEETDCNARADTCTLDVRLDCGPIPEQLDPAQTVCLPRFRCLIGQEIRLDRRCDGAKDCRLDESDEVGCQ